MSGEPECKQRRVQTCPHDQPTNVGQISPATIVWFSCRQPRGDRTAWGFLGRLGSLPGGGQALEVDAALLTSEVLSRGLPPVGPKGSTAPGNDSQATKYRILQAQRLAALNAVLWDETGAWFDYDLENKKNWEFYPSNLTPLWAGCFSDPGVADKALKYLEVRAQQVVRVHCRQHRPLPTLSRTCREGRFLRLCPLSQPAGPAEPPGGSCEPRREGPGRGHLASRRAQRPGFQSSPTHSHGNVWNLLGQPDPDLPICPRIESEPTLMSTRKSQPCMRNMTLAMVDSPVAEGSMKFRNRAPLPRLSQEGFGWTNRVVLMLLERYGDRLTSGAQLAFLEPHCLVAALLPSLLFSLLPW
ncbi:trehalase-like [Macaca nemestrina]|uniref:trehalase-like n=1 Tax=Macaca nemestrina TaxID=9545 RepID=UPI0039B9705A